MLRKAKRTRDDTRWDAFPAIFETKSRTAFLSYLALNEPISRSALADAAGVYHVLFLKHTEFFLREKIIVMGSDCLFGKQLALNTRHPAYKELHAFALAIARKLKLRKWPRPKLTKRRMPVSKETPAVLALRKKINELSARGFNQTEIADRLGKHRSYITSVANDGRIRESVILPVSLPRPYDFRTMFGSRERTATVVTLGLRELATAVQLNTVVGRGGTTRKHSLDDWYRALYPIVERGKCPGIRAFLYRLRMDLPGRTELVTLTKRLAKLQPEYSGMAAGTKNIRIYAKFRRISGTAAFAPYE